MAEDLEQLKRRLEQLEKNQKILISQINQSMVEISFYPKIDLFYYLIREIKNECDFDLLKEYLLDKKIIPNPEDYVKFRKEHKLFRTYNDEKTNTNKLLEHFKSMIRNPSPDISLFNYVNKSNLIIIQNRFKIKKQILLDRGFKEDSEEVKEIDKIIVEIQKDIESLEKEYYVKKEDAERIFTNLFSKKDEMVERIRELPLMYEIHLEPHNKSLYYETISNYWLGNFNASICMLSVLLESFLKEIYYFKEKENSDDTMEPLINKCRTKELITDDEKILLVGFTDTIRNKYLHASLNKILPDIIVPAYKIDLANPSKKPEPTYIIAENLPTIRSIVKYDVDKIRSKELILKSVKLIEEIVKRNYPSVNSTPSQPSSPSPSTLPQSP